MLVASALVSSGPLPADAAPDSQLRHVGSFFVTDNLMDGGDQPTSAEIVDITPDGRTMVYTDSFTAGLGFVDISDPSAPVAQGILPLPGDPTSVAIHKGWALVAVVTSVDPDGDGPLNELDAPTGELLVIDLATRATVRSIALAGQPDAVAVSPNGGRYAAITIENERDEDENDGLIPQPPAGVLQILDLAGQPSRWRLRTVDLTGLAEIAPADPEPEYVDINSRNQAVVSMQENNHLVIVDLRTARVIHHFSAGAVDVPDVDSTEEELGPQENGVIELTGSLVERRREPDSVAWIDHDSFATANEGDYEDENGVEGGSRSFTIFNIDGTVEFEAGNSFEHAVVRAGHYPEARSENKGSEPEGLEVARYRGRTYLFVGSERANIVGVYDVTSGTPVMTQLLPTGIGPEGLKFTHDGLLAVTSEVDGLDEGFAVRPLITLFQAGADVDWHYPQLVSGEEDGLPIPWVALSGLSGDPTDPHTLWAVSDSFLAQAWLYRIDVASQPATIVERIPVGVPEDATQLNGEFDLEGVAARPEGGFWLASEGRTNAGSSRPNLIIRTDADGNVLQSVPLPASLVAFATSSGLEGVAVTGTEAAEDEAVWVVIQREWDDDDPGFVKIGRYAVATGDWTFARYPLDPVESPAGGWVGLSEITALPDGRLAIVERDNQLGQEARIKRIYGVDPASVEFAPHSGPLPLLEKTLLRDVYADLDAASISVPDKLEGFAVGADGQAYLATDNDGVDENYGETVFLRLASFAPAPPDLGEVPIDGVRFATFNASLNRNNAGELIDDLSAPGNAQAAAVAEIIQRTRPDMLLINEFDFDEDGLAAQLFQENYLSVPHSGTDPVVYPYRFVAPSNTGIPSGFDLNNDGSVGGPDDALGFGFFPGQFGMAVYSMYPIDEDGVRTFQHFLWKDMPGALLPDDPSTAAPDDWYSADELEAFRLSSKSHWDLPIEIGGRTVHFLVSHPTPPVFDGVEDRNGTRNYDEIRFWADYVHPGRSGYIYDDDGGAGGLQPGTAFVIAGDQNADPLDGDSIPGAIQQLIEHPRVNTMLTPESEGAVEQAFLQGGANLDHESDPRFDTADFADSTPGNLRADYVLPSKQLRIVSAGVFWPLSSDPLFPLVGTFPFPTSDHRLVWVDVRVPGMR